MTIAYSWNQNYDLPKCVFFSYVAEVGFLTFHIKVWQSFYIPELYKHIMHFCVTKLWCKPVHPAFSKPDCNDSTNYRFDLNTHRRGCLPSVSIAQHRQHPQAVLVKRWSHKRYTSPGLRRSRAVSCVGQHQLVTLSPSDAHEVNELINIDVLSSPASSVEFPPLTGQIISVCLEMCEDTAGV